MSKKLEQVLECLINEESDRASELLHDVIVEKARTIYQDLVNEEDEDEDEDECEEELEENFAFEAEGEEEEFGDEDDAMGGDETDDFMGDVEPGPDLGGEI